MTRRISPLASIPYKSRHNQFQLYWVIFAAASLKLPRTVQTCRQSSQHRIVILLRVVPWRCIVEHRIMKLPFPLSLVEWIECSPLSFLLRCSFSVWNRRETCYLHSFNIAVLCLLLFVFSSFMETAGSLETLKHISYNCVKTCALCPHNAFK